MDESMYNLIIVYVEIFLEAKLYNFFNTGILETLIIAVIGFKEKDRIEKI